MTLSQLVVRSNVWHCHEHIPVGEHVFHACAHDRQRRGRTHAQLAQGSMLLRDGILVRDARPG
jgi:hypothetical protein